MEAVKELMNSLHEYVIKNKVRYELVAQFQDADGNTIRYDWREK